MSSFENDWMHGYKKDCKSFEKWCEKATPILGRVTQCGFLELDGSGNMYIVGNRPDFGEEYLSHKAYILDSHLTFSSKFENYEGEIRAFHTRDEYELLHFSKDSLFQEKFGLHCGFSYKEKIDNDTHRIYWFASDSSEIYNDLINNLVVFKKFLEYFKKENEPVIKYFQQRKFNISDKKENYFSKDDEKAFFSEREKINYLLHSMGILDKNETITKREWQCIKIFQLGKTASKTGEMLGISRRTVETHFNSIKEKLNINSKSEIMNYIS